MKMGNVQLAKAKSPRPFELNDDMNGRNGDTSKQSI